MNTSSILDSSKAIFYLWEFAKESLFLFWYGNKNDWDLGSPELQLALDLFFIGEIT